MCGEPPASQVLAPSGIEVLTVLTRRLLRWTVITTLVAFALTATPGQAQVTFTGPSTITVTEDGTSPIFNFQLTNNSGGPLSNFIVGVAFGSPSGDLSDDFATSFSLGSCTVVTLADGASCDYTFQINTDNGAGETDADFFSETIAIHALFDSVDPATGGLQHQDLSQSFVLTVNDPTVTPEPASFLLLGSGVLGMLGTLRRKLRS
jgi:PEP-CTERM motif